VIDYDDPEFTGTGDAGAVEYEGSSRPAIRASPGKMPDDEWDAITAELHLGHDRRSRAWSITTAAPTGWRSGNVLTGSMASTASILDPADVPLQRLVLAWTISVVAGTHVCLRQVRATAMYDAIARHKGHASLRRARS